jgi:hypothetical protein
MKLASRSRNELSLYALCSAAVWLGACSQRCSDCGKQKGGGQASAAATAASRKIGCCGGQHTCTQAKTAAAAAASWQALLPMLAAQVRREGEGEPHSPAARDRRRQWP